ncbi:5-carboxymethyl-2-hydroxymuconate isomerase [Tropicibacter oceani]|uniref:5-carboxymethyl-2-hydroxymuconate isomerase n=1 Tax=Tropicibacter oceani TaxID=3058420 RepID=A0ABY8QG77_9RHOB|nr:5-carboxymethyl-2-hydroxymuconate isomerase [Tropicibacter oceani]WGW03519.1 5-carboxymethyl-2-hydroxymuconate isomerase [Tropicibacter oceani]
MPHFQIDYSGNLETVVDMAAFCETIRACAARIETFPLAGIRVRAVRVDHCALADGNPAHGFIDISIRLRAGRPRDVKAEATQRIFDAAQGFLADAMQTHSIALSLEMRDIDPDLSPKTGTIRDHMKG